MSRPLCSLQGTRRGGENVCNFQQTYLNWGTQLHIHRDPSKFNSLVFACFLLCINLLMVLFKKALKNFYWPIIILYILLTYWNFQSCIINSEMHRFLTFISSRDPAKPMIQTKLLQETFQEITLACRSYPRCYKAKRLLFGIVELQRRDLVSSEVISGYSRRQKIERIYYLAWGVTEPIFWRENESKLRDEPENHCIMNSRCLLFEDIYL